MIDRCQARRAWPAEAEPTFPPSWHERASWFPSGLFPLHDLDRVCGVVAGVGIAGGDDKALEHAGRFVAVHGFKDIVEAFGLLGFEVGCDPRPFFGQEKASLQDRRKLGFAFEAGPQVLILQSEIPLAPDPEGRGVSGTCRLREGERRPRGRWPGQRWRR